MPTATHSFRDLGIIDLNLPHGRYVITDPCYVFPSEMWVDLCEQIFCNDDRKDGCDTGVIEMDGHQIWWSCTAYGDGGYNVRKGGAKVGEFGVDAGMFAIFPIEFVQKYKPDLIEENSLAAVVDMCGTVVASGRRRGHGDMECGDITVNTSDDNGQDDEDEDDEGEDD
jgi:hypothetical protein